MHTYIVYQLFITNDTQGYLMKDIYHKKGFIKFDLSYDHIIERIPRSSGRNVCRITLPKWTDGIPVYVFVDKDKYSDKIKPKKYGGYDDPVLHI